MADLSKSESIRNKVEELREKYQSIERERARIREEIRQLQNGGDSGSVSEAQEYAWQYAESKETRFNIVVMLLVAMLSAYVGRFLVTSELTLALH